MADVTIQIELPEPLVREARERGLLAPQAVAGMLRDALRRQRAGAFFAAADRLASDGTPPMTQEEVQAEIEAARAQRRGRDARGG